MVESIPSYRPAADDERRKGDAWAQTMRVASNQKVVRPGWQPHRRDASPRLFRPKSMVKMSQVGAFPPRSTASAALLEQALLPCIFDDEVMQNRNTMRRKIVTHIIDVRQFFLFTTIGVSGGEAAKPPRRSRRA